MKFLHGVISDKLRGLFKPTDTAWTPQRDSSQPTAHKNAKGVEGHSLGGRHRTADGKRGKK